MNTYRTVLLLAMVAGMAACTSVDVDRYRMPHSRPVSAQHQAVEPETAARAARLAAPEHPSPSTPPPAPRVGVPDVPTPSSGPTPPVPLITCDPGGCWSAGERFQGGAADTYLDRNGRLCRGSGGWIQCY